MKKTKVLIAALTVTLLAGILVLVFVTGKKPFKELEVSDIASAVVQLSPPDITISIVEMEELVQRLKDVVIYNEDNSYTDYVGQGVIFTLTMTDGTQKEITVFYPFLIMDGVGYKTKYGPCEELNDYANQLLNKIGY